MATATQYGWESEYHRGEYGQPGYYSIEATGMGGKSIVVADMLNRDGTIDPDEDRANARLLAKAPAVLACLRMALWHLERPWIPITDVLMGTIRDVLSGDTKVFSLRAWQNDEDVRRIYDQMRERMTNS